MAAEITIQDIEAKRAKRHKILMTTAHVSMILFIISIVLATAFRKREDSNIYRISSWSTVIFLLIVFYSLVLTRLR